MSTNINIHADRDETRIEARFSSLGKGHIRVLDLQVGPSRVTVFLDRGQAFLLAEALLGAYTAFWDAEWASSETDGEPF